MAFLVGYCGIAPFTSRSVTIITVFPATSVSALFLESFWLMLSFHDLQYDFMHFMVIVSVMAVSGAFGMIHGRFFRCCLFLFYMFFI